MSVTAKLLKVQAALPQDIDCAIITFGISQRYITGFDFQDGYVLVGHDWCVLLTDSRYIEAANEHAAKSGLDITVDTMKGSFAAILDGYFTEHGVKTVGFEETRLSVERHDWLEKEIGQRRLVPLGGAVEECRIRKDRDEMDAMICAQRIAESALEHIYGWITPEKTEKEVALELEFYMRSHGAERSAFDVIAVSGSASSRPHGVPRDVKHEKGFLTMDFGAVYDGYLSDMTRTICLGRATDEMKKVYNTVLEAQLAAIDAIKIGADMGEIDAVARKVIGDAGYGEYFGHGLGLGVGMEIHEAPGLSGRYRGKQLEAGHVITCEPGIYLEGRFGVRIEDMGAAADNGYEDFTLAKKELIEIF